MLRAAVAEGERATSNLCGLPLFTTSSRRRHSVDMADAAAEAPRAPAAPAAPAPAADKRPEPSSEAALAASRSVLSLAEALLIAAVFAAAAYLAYNERLYAIEKYGRVIHEFDREGRRRRGAGSAAAAAAAASSAAAAIAAPLMLITLPLPFLPPLLAPAVPISRLQRGSTCVPPRTSLRTASPSSSRGSTCVPPRPRAGRSRPASPPRCEGRA